MSNPEFCAKCCMDLDIDPMLLFFPEKLDEPGLEFVRVHGLDVVTLGMLRKDAILLSDGRVKIKHRCHQLDEHNLCKIYENRPQICRDYICETRLGSDVCTTSKIIPLTIEHVANN